MREVEKLIEELNRKWERRMEQQEKLFQQCYDELLKEYEKLKAEVKKGANSGESCRNPKLFGLLHAIGVLCAEFEAECRSLPEEARSRVAQAAKSALRIVEILSKALEGGGNGGLQVLEKNPFAQRSKGS